ncbi:Cki1 protein [Candida orthopsilosis Co 90-125]|uniref:Cki1 protein n=1 Tax=Candida orthopsilosis (strain 90-125) TaxID=1136231 RepID=H8X2L0_CANO9|nr:Cki1 protein [Candida orthopsilosis Co 90-125]CCG25557.1 Cki1 protein [Candida orthopsilosis Co 90-125]
MEISPASLTPRPRSRSRTRNSTANSRSTSATRRPSLSGTRKSLSSSSLNKLTITPTQIDDERSVPSVQAVLDNSLPADFFKQDIIALTKALRIHKWHKRNLNIHKLKITRISGALTNSIYKIDYVDEEQDIHLPSLLLRVYGKNVDELIDRDSELMTLIKLSQKRIGPRLLGIFTNGRFEQFLEGFVTLTKDQIRDQVISQMIGRRMKDLHYKVELTKEESNSPVPTCWRLIEKWLKIFETEYKPGYEKAGVELEDIFMMDFDSFKKLVFKYKDWLFDKYKEDGFSSNYKFCHNDTQYGNLLLHNSFEPEEIVIDTPLGSSTNLPEVAIKSTSNKKDSNLVVIDFEYSGPNFPAFDIVNHFSEWMSNYHDPERSYFINDTMFPTQLEQLNFIKAYIEYDFQLPSSNLKSAKSDGELLNSSDKQAVSIIQYEIEKMFNECIYWRSSVQIFWALWGLIQNGPIEPRPEMSRKESEQGVDSTYNITVEMEKFGLQDLEITAGDAITSSDDDFDYLKYSNQKIAIVVGDSIQFNLLDKDRVDSKYHEDIKYLSSKTYDL